jgi:hypothetical protein
MTGPGADHPLVSEYLHDVDAQVTAILSQHDQDLRQRVLARLAWLPPDADDATVARVLAQFGSPPQAALRGAAAAGRRRLRLRAWFARLNWQRRIALGTGLALVIAAVAYVVVVQTTAPLVFSGVSGWWYPQDGLRAVGTSADGHSQSTVPIRSGQQQGYYVALVNPSDLTQTILGPATGQGLPADSIGAPLQPADISVNAPNLNVDRGSNVFTGVKWVLPGDIPPNQTRVVRVLWTSTVCEQDKGSAIGGDELALRVRVGWIVRIEVIPLDQGWYLAGPSRGKCP